MESCVENSKQKYPLELRQRLQDFAVDVINLLFLLPYIKEMEVFRIQLSKSSTSMGANYEESQAGTYKEFSNRIQICLREAKETHYFLKVLKQLKLVENGFRFKNKEKFNSRLEVLLRESDELTKIFGSISAKTKRN